MVELEEREWLLGSLRGYLEELRESGVEELPLAPAPSPATAELAAPPSPRDEPGVTVSGNPRARLLLVVVGEGFAGPSGELLANVVKAMGFAPAEVSLVAVGDRVFDAGPLRLSLTGTIKGIAPEVVVALGERAAQLLMGSGEAIAKLRGRFLDLEGIPVMATLHPDQMLADPSLKRGVWNEMQQVMARLKANSAS